MDLFSQRPRYKVGDHARQRWFQRALHHHNKAFNSVGNIIYCVNNAQLLHEYKRLRVLRYQDLIFPCAKLGSENPFDWKVMTVLTWDMVANNPQALIGSYRPHIKLRLKKLAKIKKIRRKKEAAQL